MFWGGPVLSLAEKEATSRGVALLALESLGIIEDTMLLSPTIDKIYEPNSNHHAIYQEALEMQVELYNRLIDIV